MRKLNKKAATVDNIWAIVIFFALVIFFLAIIIFWNSVSVLDDDLWDKSSVGQKIKTNAQNAVNTFDYILIFVYFGLHLGILVLVYLLRTHPVVYIASIIIIAILAMIAAPISNAYEDIIVESDMITAAADIPKTNFIMSELPKFEIIWGFLTVIVLLGFAKHEGLI